MSMAAKVAVMTKRGAVSVFPVAQEESHEPKNRGSHGSRTTAKFKKYVPSLSKDDLLNCGCPAFQTYNYYD